MNQKLRFLCFQGIQNSLPSFGAKLDYSRIKIEHIADSLLKLQIKIGMHLISVEVSQLLTLLAGNGLFLTNVNVRHHIVQHKPIFFTKKVGVKIWHETTKSIMLFSSILGMVIVWR